MSDWQYQVRIDLTDAAAEAARGDPEARALPPLAEILEANHAGLVCQYDAFAGYVAEAERNGTDKYPLYAWTKATIEQPEKKAKYLKSFTVYVDGREVYERAAADALEAALKPLVGGGLVTRFARHDTNPANNPQPPERYRK